MTAVVGVLFAASKVWWFVARSSGIVAWGLSALAVLWGVQPRFLNAALDLIDAEHGGMDRYLTERMRLDDAARARLAGLYLEAG